VSKNENRKENEQNDESKRNISQSSKKAFNVNLFKTEKVIKNKDMKKSPEDNKLEKMADIYKRDNLNEDNNNQGIEGEVIKESLNVDNYNQDIKEEDGKDSLNEDNNNQGIEGEDIKESFYNYNNNNQDIKEEDGKDSLNEDNNNQGIEREDKNSSNDKGLNINEDVPLNDFIKFDFCDNMNISQDINMRKYSEKKDIKKIKKKEGVKIIALSKRRQCGNEIKEGYDIAKEKEEQIRKRANIKLSRIMEDCWKKQELIFKSSILQQNYIFKKALLQLDYVAEQEFIEKKRIREDEDDLIKKVK
jgi:hypothetical protein